MQRSLKIIVVLIGLCNPLFFNAHAQVSPPANHQLVISQLIQEKYQFDPKKVTSRVQNKILQFPASGFTFNSFERALPAQNREFSICNRVIYPLPENHYARSLGYFCRQELKLDRLTPVPIRFRLGSMDYANWMEGKQHSVKTGF